jgi:hypothetical protein
MAHWCALGTEGTRTTGRSLVPAGSRNRIPVTLNPPAHRNTNWANSASIVRIGRINSEQIIALMTNKTLHSGSKEKSCNVPRLYVQA